LDDRLQRQHVSEKALGQFESETGIRVKHLPAPETSQGQLRLIRELLGERDTPDVLGVDVVWTGLLEDALLDLKPFFSSELSAAAEPDLVSSYAVKSRVVAVPYHPHVNVLYVISNGGDQPNVVPQGASVWYYFRETYYPHIKELWEIGDRMATGAVTMTDTKWDSTLIGTAWPGYFNKPIAEEATENAKLIGLPAWSDADQTLAKALQRELKVTEKGLATKLDELKTPNDPEQYYGGPSDDIGDISWNVPTIVLRYPSNIPNLPGHNWANGIAMATPIAHKGALAGAKVQALTLFDLMVKPELLTSAKAYFNDVQTKGVKYQPFLRPSDKPSIWLNKETMDKYRPEMKKYYYDAAKYSTYLEQLGIKYPTVRTDSTTAAVIGTSQTDDGSLR
jgi:aminobenzoyl-glutamate utilization protein B